MNNSSRNRQVRTSRTGVRSTTADLSESNSHEWDVDPSRINRLKEEYKRDRHVKQHAATTITNATSATIRNSLLNNGNEEMSNEQRTFSLSGSVSSTLGSPLVDSMMFRNSKGFMENNTIESLDELARVTVLNDNEPQYEVRRPSIPSRLSNSIASRVTPTIHRSFARHGMSNIFCEGKRSREKRRENRWSHSSHLDGVRCVAFHPVESMVITGSEDRTLKLWNLDKAAMLRKSVSLTCVWMHRSGEIRLQIDHDNTRPRTDLYLSTAYVSVLRCRSQTTERGGF